MPILISEEIDSPAIRKLGEKYQLLSAPDLWREPAKLKKAIQKVRAILVRNQTHLNNDVLQAAGQLQVIGRVGVGLDNIDVDAATERGIVIVAPLNANATSVAELTLAFLLALARKIPGANRSAHSGNWERKQFTGIELDKKTLVICGFGRVGRMVAARARAFGMRIVVFDPYLKTDSPQLGEVGATLATKLTEALDVADFVSVHLPLTRETRHLFNVKAFTAMKPGAYFINTSRGGVVDEAALLHFLQEGHLGGAALDVREVEPPKEKNGLEGLENVILTPHIGAFTSEAQNRTVEAVCEDIDRVLSGQPAVNFVNISEPAMPARA